MSVVSLSSRWGKTRDLACDVLRHVLATEGGHEDEEGGRMTREVDDDVIQMAACDWSELSTRERC